MHLTAPSHWSRSIGTGGRDASERVVTIVGMRRVSSLPAHYRSFWQCEGKQARSQWCFVISPDPVVMGFVSTSPTGRKLHRFYGI